MTRLPLRIHIITQEDPFYLPVFFREFFAHLPRDRFIVTGVDVTPPFNQKTRVALARKLYAFYGPVDFVRLGSRYAVMKMLDLLVPGTLWSGTVPRIARRHGVRCGIVPNVNAREYVERLRGLDLDLLVSVAASQIFKEELLSVPGLDAINIHTGALPRYRGMMPVFWQMYDRRASIGITVHAMARDIDAGPVLLDREVPLDGERNLDAVIRKTKRQGAHALLEVLGRYCDEAVQRVVLDRSAEGYRSFPGRDEAIAFRRMGFELL